MNNLFSYLKWRGDLSFYEAPFNEVDNAILCAFSYIPLEDFLTKDKTFSILELYALYQKNVKKEKLFKQNQKKLFDNLQQSKRFQNVKVAQFVNEVEQIKEKQFCAMTFILTEDLLFVAYRGTDESLIAWKENFNLSYMDYVPSQKRAVSYLEEILMHTNKKVIVGGHSKGGNLAMYAYLFCNEKLQSKMIQVYNNDGPGLHKNIEIEKKELEQKIITFLPKASIIGNLFENLSTIFFIKSSSFGILHHDLYTWEVENNHFIYIKEMDKKTKDLCNFLNKMLEDLSLEKKEKIISFLYETIADFGISNVEEFIEQIGKKQILKKYNITIEDMQIVFKILPVVMEIFKKLKL